MGMHVSGVDMAYRIVGISGSPVKDGNMETFLRTMLDAVARDDVHTGIVNLSRMRIGDCIHCNFCLTGQKPGKYCSLKDDAQEVFEKVEAADIIVLGSPVYFMRTSARLAALMDRLRVFVFGNVAGGRLRNKVGVSAAVAWLRNGGLETTHLSHLLAFLTLEMIPVSTHSGVSPLGASALASVGGSGGEDAAARQGILHDHAGLDSARLLMERALELARLLKRE
jgi:multimeric flavodoxin WrbA